jgi:phage virion morphogenesis protein
MSDADLTLLVDWVDGLLLAIRPAGRRRIARSVAIALRRSQQQRIADQRNPDGTPYVPRKVHKLRNKAGRIKRGKMFKKLRTTQYLRTYPPTAEGVSIGFTERAARIARVHQYGFTDQAFLNGPSVRYPKRVLLGFSATDVSLVRHLLVQCLTD